MARKNPEDCFTNREVVYLNDELKEFSSWYCQRQDISFSSFARLSMYHYIKRIETELSQQRAKVSSTKVVTNSEQNHSTNGLFSSAQVAQLIDALTKK